MTRGSSPDAATTSTRTSKAPIQAHSRHGTGDRTARRVVSRGQRRTPPPLPRPASTRARRRARARPHPRVPRRGGPQRPASRRPRGARACRGRMGNAPRSDARSPNASATTQTSVASRAGTNRFLTNASGERPSRLMITMFVGLPCGTASEKALATATTPSRSGRNSSGSSRASTSTSGTISTTAPSRETVAVSSAHVAQVSANRRIRLPRAHCPEQPGDPLGEPRPRRERGEPDRRGEEDAQRRSLLHGPVL